LLTHPEQLEAVRKDRSLVPKAIEEALRWEAPILRGWRYVRRDVEIDGHPLPEGSIVMPILASANRDPAKFREPDNFDIFREHPVRPIPFSIGPHVCIGQHLARVEMARALNGLLDRLPNLRLDPDHPPPQVIGHGGRVPRAIHVRFDPA
jgi:cytochrome P450